MPWSKRWKVPLLALLLGSNAFAGDGLILGFGAEGDTSDSFSFSAFGDFGITRKTWISVTAAKAQAKGVISQLDTVYGDIGLDHHFDPIGIRISAASRLSLANGLLDYRVDAGIDIKFGLRSLGLEAGSRQTAIDSGRVDSVSAGFLFPASDASDIELRIGYDDSENFGGTLVFSFFWFLYGT